MMETAGIAFATLFATISPIEVGIVFTGLAPRGKKAQRSMALKGCLVALGILAFFALFGQALLSSLGITLPSLRTAGGVLLLLMGIDRVFAIELPLTKVRRFLLHRQLPRTQVFFGLTSSPRASHPVVPTVGRFLFRQIQYITIFFKRQYFFSRRRAWPYILFLKKEVLRPHWINLERSKQRRSV